MINFCTVLWGGGDEAPIAGLHDKPHLCTLDRRSEAEPTRLSGKKMSGERQKKASRRRVTPSQTGFTRVLLAPS